MAVKDQLVAYPVWDSPTRWFHWINALSVLGLIVVGILILFSGSLGISAQGRVTVKTIHVWLGYVMTLNLMWRFVWAFVGSRYARWRAILPGPVLAEKIELDIGPVEDEAGGLLQIGMGSMADRTG
jgi:Ni/Fe-hydrogenase 1 B-type cytochrome subunit